MTINLSQLSDEQLRQYITKTINTESVFLELKRRNERAHAAMIIVANIRNKGRK